MKPAGLITVLLLALPFAGVCAPPSHEYCGEPAVRFERTCVDFGDIPRRGGDLSADFEFENMCDEPVVITRVTLSCSSIQAFWPHSPVEPGGRGVVRLVYEPHKMSPGIFHKAVQIHSRSAGTSHCTTLTFSGNSVNARRLPVDTPPACE